MNKRVAGELVSQYVNGMAVGRTQKEGLRKLFAYDREVDALLAAVDRLIPAFRPVDPDPAFAKQLRIKLDHWQREEKREKNVAWRKLLIPAAAAFSVASAAALVLLIGRLRGSGGHIERSFPTFSAG